MGHYLDAFRDLRGWNGSEPDALCLSFNPCNDLLFRRAGCEVWAKHPFYTWFMLHVRSCSYKFYTGDDCGDDRRAHGFRSATSRSSGSRFSDSGIFCSKPFRFLGISASRNFDANFLKILYGLLWDCFHGNNPRISGRTLHWPLCLRVAHLGSQLRTTVVWFRGLLHPECRAGSTTLYFRHLLRASG